MDHRTKKARQLFAPVNRASSVSGVSPSPRAPPTKDGQKTQRKERSLASRLLCTHASMNEGSAGDIIQRGVHPVGKAIFQYGLPIDTVPPSCLGRKSTYSRLMSSKARLEPKSI